MPTLATARRRLPRRVRALAAIGAFVLVFVGTTLAIDRAVEARPAGSQAADIFTGKLAFLEEHLSDYEVVYVGSSRSRRAFKPGTFEARLARAGIEARAFNLGIPGLTGFATEAVVRRLLAWDTRNLRLLVVAPEDLGVEIDGDLARTGRQVLWHEPGLTLSALEAVIQTAGAPWSWDPVASGWNHAQSLLLNVTASGRLASRIQFETEASEGQVLGRRGDGYRRNPIGTFREADKRAGLATVRAAEAQPAAKPRRFELDYVNRLHKLAAARGVQLVFVREPTLTTLRSRGVPDQRTRFLRWLADNRPSAPVLDFGNPQRHPELFDPGLFFNLGHLNDRGATRFSRMVAREVAPLLSAQG